MLMTAKSAKSLTDRYLIINDDKGRQEIILENSTYSLGRDMRCDIVLHSQFVSRRHATLIKIADCDGGDRYRILDGGTDGKASANGLIINGQKVSIWDLEDGDKIFFGSQVYAVYYHRTYDRFPTVIPDDPFDITLIDPSMIVNEIEESKG